MKNLVLGSEGFIGKSFVKFLESKGEEVIRFDIKNDNDKEDARIAVINFDNIDRVYFLAWDVGGAKFLYKEELQLGQLDWNLKLLQNVMYQLYKAKKPFLFISSQLSEDCDTVYGVTKRLGEVWTKLLGGTFVREWNVYGPIEENSIRSHVISDFISQAVDTKEINMLTTGEEKRQFIHIDDVCEAWYTVMNKNLKGVYDITSFEWIRVIDLANIISSLTGAKVIPGRNIGYTPDTPVKDKIPGWFPRVEFKEGLIRMIEDYKKLKK